ncbi:MAG: hypothetical protein R2939_18910 [Kofleriaceae bacterium]
MISVRRDPGAALRAAAAPHVRRRLRSSSALARYVADNDRGVTVLGDFIDGNQRGRCGPAAGVRAAEILLTAGEVHDLRDIFDDLNQRFFDGTIDAQITWGHWLGARRAGAAAPLGSYVVEDRLIRMHRPSTASRAAVLRRVDRLPRDAAPGPRHQGPKRRREFHSKAFLADEARFPRYAEARAWERANLEALLYF